MLIALLNFEFAVITEDAKAAADGIRKYYERHKMLTATVSNIVQQMQANRSLA